MVRTGDNQYYLDAFPLDLLDSEIITLLQMNARRTNTDIARILNVSEPTIKNHIDALTKNETIKILAVPDPGALGYVTECLIFIKIRPGQLKSVSSALLQMNEGNYLSHIAGIFDILFGVLLKSPGALSHFITESLAKIPGILSTESAYIIRTEKIIYDFKLPTYYLDSSQNIKLFTNGKPESNKIKFPKKSKVISLDKVDYEIITLLQDNGRRTNSNIARKIKASKSTVRNRIDRLLQNEIIKIVTMLNPESVGYNMLVVIGIKIKQGQLEKVGNKLFELKEVLYFAYHYGRYDILIGVALRESEELFRFISYTLNNILGIQSMDRFHILSTLMINHDWKPFKS